MNFHVYDYSIVFYAKCAIKIVLQIHNEAFELKCNQSIILSSSVASVAVAICAITL